MHYLDERKGVVLIPNRWVDPRGRAATEHKVDGSRIQWDSWFTDPFSWTDIVPWYRKM